MNASNIARERRSTLSTGSGSSGDISPVFAFGSNKIENRHLEQLAFVYVRQSDPQQVRRHRESTDLQYQLVPLAMQLGWPQDRIVVIDDDLGISAKHIEGRAGFQRLMTEVGLDHAGIIIGIEMSRLARSCKDWYQLLELCALFGTVLADPDGVYDPGNYNDRLLLGLKGTMSEAELHIMNGRLAAGRMNKARRGELFNHAPIGYMRTASGEMVLDPDEQAQSVVRLIFDKFQELDSLNATAAVLGSSPDSSGLPAPLRRQSRTVRMETTQSTNIAKHLTPSHLRWSLLLRSSRSGPASQNSWTSLDRTYGSANGGMCSPVEGPASSLHYLGT